MNEQKPLNMDLETIPEIEVSGEPKQAGRSSEESMMRNMTINQSSKVSPPPEEVGDGEGDVPRGSQQTTNVIQITPLKLDSPMKYTTRRKFPNSSISEQRYKKAVLKAAAELSHEFSEHYWKDVLLNGQEDPEDGMQRLKSNNSSAEAVKKGFIFYLNASGKYLILREHLRGAISNLVQQKCLNMRPSGFHNHRDFQAYLHDMYVYLVDEMHEILNSTSLLETDPLKSSFDRLLQQTNCGSDQELSKASLYKRQIADLGIFAEEAFAQGDFESCHKLHLQRICKDRESAKCWTEFAILWLSKGDDRMAEIAVREALHKDPSYLYALLISGVLMIRHGDEAGLDCLGSALNMKPYSPEIMVIYAVANTLTGNEERANHFFRKAAYVRRVIGGQSTKDVDRLFDEKEAAGQFNMSEFVKGGIDTGEGEEILAPPVEGNQFGLRSSTLTAASKSFGASVEFALSAATTDGQLLQQPSNVDDAVDADHTPGEITAPMSEMIDGTPTADDIHEETEQDPESPKKKGKKGKSKNKLQGKSKDNVQKKSKKKSAAAIKDKDKAEKKRKSSSKSKEANNNIPVVEEPAPVIIEEPSKPPVKVRSKPSFNETLQDMKEEEAMLPFLTPSILSPWDVTEFSEKMLKHLQTVDFLETPAAAFNDQQTSSSRYIGSAETIQHVHNTISNDTGVASDTQIKNEYNKLSSKGEFSRVSNASIVSKKKRRSSEKTTELNAFQSDKGHSEIPPTQEKSSRFTDRLGSELIWSAKVLVNLRLFDFVDGILAKQLNFYGKRTVQFLYLRSLSLFFRQRDDEALRLINEAIELESSNAKFWTLQGHCYYNQGKAADAVTSYEKALKLPHTNENRHLLYLRYGSLVLNEGKTKLAKRVFLHGVSKYPTPYMWLALGNTCFQRKEYDQAESAFSEANRLDNVNPITWAHLSLSSLMQNKKSLAEQAYKWAIRFGLKKSPILDEIHRLQKDKGFGNPSFTRIPTCVPHEYFLRRMGRTKPFNIYKEGLSQGRPKMDKERFADTENEGLLKKKLEHLANIHQPHHHHNSINEEWDGEGSTTWPIDLDPLAEPEDPNHDPDSHNTNEYIDGEISIPDLVTLKNPPERESKSKSIKSINPA